MDLHLSRPSGTLRYLRGKRVLIGMDAKAKSLLWYYSCTCERSVEIEKFIFEHGLLVLNAWSPYSTYSSATGLSNIDVSFVTES